MAVNKHVNKDVSAPLFTKENYTWMAIGAVIIAIGLFLMSGGKNEADKFDYNVVYSTRRITVAPILILIGFMVEVYAIFKKPGKTDL
jgi:hypothetical protein